MSWLSSFLHPERGYQAGQEQLDKYYNQANQALGGENVGDYYNNYMQSLMDPQGLYDKWSKGYETSGAAKDAMGMAQQNGLDAASSMGLMGSSAGLQALQAGTSQIQNQDKQQYLQDLMDKYKAGAGLVQNAANQQGQNAMTQGQNSAGMQFGKTNASGSTFGNVLGGVGSFAGGVMTPGLSGKFGQMIGFNPYGGGK
jgi:hypothetical protein